MQSLKRALLMSGLLALLALALSLTMSAAQAAPAAQQVAPVNWSSCHQELGLPFECATVQAPLDYNAPNRATIGIALVRLPAGDPDNRIGSLFLNPGGPGGSGVDFVLQAGPFLYTPEVRARFDLVGFDPRGIMRSTGLRCFDSPSQWDRLLTDFAYPITPEEEAIWQGVDMTLIRACNRNGGRIIDYMTTANVARDLDLLRQAVGDEGLTYAGFSYGSYLGATYANLFPDKVRAVVVDAVLDPVAWSTGAPGEGDTIPFSTRLRSDAGAQATLDEFFRLCDEGLCAFGPDSAARFEALRQQVAANPPLLPLPDGSAILYVESYLIADTLSVLYNSVVWESFAEFLAALEFLTSPAEAGALLHDYWRQAGFANGGSDRFYPNSPEGFPGVACSDTDNPTSYAAWSAAAADAEANFGYFGRLWTWVSSICAQWPGSQATRYAGPFTAETANPVLIVGNLFDPATRYEGAVTLSGLLPNSRLLTLAGWGHGSLFLSQCADATVAGYLVNLTLPPEGTVCTQDFVPFAPAAQRQADDQTAAGRALLARIQTPSAVREHVR